jgi:hypothetical protein
MTSTDVHYIHNYHLKSAILTYMATCEPRCITRPNSLQITVFILLHLLSQPWAQCQYSWQLQDCLLLMPHTGPMRLRGVAFMLPTLPLGSYKQPHWSCVDGIDNQQSCNCQRNVDTVPYGWDRGYRGKKIVTWNGGWVNWWFVACCHVHFLDCRTLLDVTYGMMLRGWVLRGLLPRLFRFNTLDHDWCGVRRRWLF